MEIVRYPPKQDWQKIIRRPLQKFEVIREAVLPILQAVQQEGDKAALSNYPYGALIFLKGDKNNKSLNN